MDIENTSTARTRTLRWLPLAGVGYALLQAAGDLTIGPFPDGETSPTKLVDFYAAHHAQVYVGGRLLELSGIFLALLGVAIWAGMRTTAPVVGVVALVGATMSAVDTAASGATYRFLGDLGVQQGVTPEALQAWHVVGAGFGVVAGTLLLLLAVSYAGIVCRAVPMWLGWVSLLLAAATISPYGFLASLVFVLWAAVAGFALVRRTSRVEGAVVGGVVNAG